MLRHNVKLGFQCSDPLAECLEPNLLRLEPLKFLCNFAMEGICGVAGLTHFFALFDLSCSLRGVDYFEAGLDP